MKFLVLLLVALFAAWLWRSRQTPDRTPRPDTRQDPRASSLRRIKRPVAMVRCAACGLHLPQADALRGSDGHHYCCAEHRRQGVRTN